MRVMLSDMEQALLREVSFEAFRLYVQCLKPVMDVRSGFIGRASEVSRAYMAIDMKFVPDRGSKRAPVTFTLKQIDSLIDELVRKGLVARAGTVSDRQKLVLKLPAAQLVALVRPLEDGDMSRHEEESTSGTPETPADAWLDRFADGYDGDTFQEHEADISQNHRITDVGGSNERVGYSTRERARGSLVPDDFAPDSHGVRLAQQHGLDLQVEAPKFVAYYQALDVPVHSADWQAKFRKWLLDAMQYRADADRRAGLNGLAPAARSATGSNGGGRFDPVAFVNRNRQGRAL